MAEYGNIQKIGGISVDLNQVETRSTQTLSDGSTRHIIIFKNGIQIDYP